MDWENVKIGDKVYDSFDSNIVVTITAIGEQKFLGIPFGATSELVFNKDKFWNVVKQLKIFLDKLLIGDYVLERDKERF